MPSEIVQQLTNGVVVRLADGDEVHCKPMTLAQAITFLDLWAIRADADKTADERYRARLTMVHAFQRAYPALAERITAADVDTVLPGFFWVESGAGLPDLPSPPTGTPPSESTPPTPVAPPT